MKPKNGAYTNETHVVSFEYILIKRCVVEQHFYATLSIDHLSGVLQIGPTTFSHYVSGARSNISFLEKASFVRIIRFLK